MTKEGNEIRWGILGTGNIAGKFAEGLKAATGARLVAVGSRAQPSADAFADRFDAPNRHASYEALVADPEVDIIYISTPHPMHAENAILCLDHGKAVLCEKPFTLNAAEARTVVERAREKGVFLMEAMWTRCLPVLARTRELIRAGAIGEPRLLVADFAFRAGWNPESRLLNLALGGGGLLDVGVYCASLAHWVFEDAPEDVAGLAHLGETGVDEQAAWSLRFPGGRLASCVSGVRTSTKHEATLYGTEGSIRLPSHWWKGTRLILTAGKSTEEMDLPYPGNGYTCEADEAARCLRKGLLESPVIPWAETVATMETLDRIRALWGLAYPQERS